MAQGPGLLRGTMRFLRSLILLGVCWIAAGGDAFACTCVGSTDPPDAAQLTHKLKRSLETARAVFIGEATAANSLMIRFRIASVWKGELGPEVVMSTGAGATPAGLLMMPSCEGSFELGRSYLVFAEGKTTETMKAHACGFTGHQDDPGLLNLLDGVALRRLPGGGCGGEGLRGGP